MLYWFFVKGLGPIAIHRLGPTTKGLENIPREGGAIIAANHLAVIDDALLPLTSALNHAREIIEDGHLFGIHIEGTRSPDGRLYKGHTGAARLAFETGCPIVPTAIIGSRELQKPGQVIPDKGKTMVIYGKPIEVEKKPLDQITHDDLRSLTDRVTMEIQKMSGQEYVNEYAQKVKEQLKAAKEAEEQSKQG